MKIFLRNFLLIYLLLSNLPLSAQDVDDKDENQKKNKSHAIRFFYQYGKVLQTADYFKGVDEDGNKTNESGEPIEKFQAFSLQYGWQTDGSKMWQQLYAYPYWGFGIYSAYFPTTDELGYPTAFYGTFIAPFKRWDKFSLNYEIGFGLTYNWKPYDPSENAYQYVIGSYNTVYIDAGIQFQYNISKHLQADLGWTFTHFSNGATRVPNMGINLFAPRLGVKYNFKGLPEFKKQIIPEYEKEREWLVIMDFGYKQKAFDTSSVSGEEKYTAEGYGIFGISSGYNWQVSHKVKFGAGIDLAYDGSVNSKIDVTNGVVTKVETPFKSKLSVGVYPSFELVINKIGLIIQPGVYVWRDDPDGNLASFYQRVGLKYHFTKNIFAGINIRAYDFSVADFIEWNIGYRMKWKKS